MAGLHLTKRYLTSSLYATARNSKIVSRTDLSFHKLIPTYENRQQLLQMAQHWLLRAEERQATGAMKKVFEDLTYELEPFIRAVRWEGIGQEGRHIYLARNGTTKAIHSMAFGREYDAGSNICPHVICVNPDDLPMSLEAINQCPQEGPDSFLFRMMVKYGAAFGLDHLAIGFRPIKLQGYKNILFQSKVPPDKVIVEDGYLGPQLVMNLQQLNLLIHGKPAYYPEFSNIFLRDLNA